MNRVFILGSGFSSCAGAPVSRSVLPAIFSNIRQDSRLSLLEEYLRGFLFRGQRNWLSTTGLDEVLSRLDLIRHYKPYPGIDYNQVSFFEEMLLEEFAHLLSPVNIDSSHPAYKGFKNLLRPDDIFISFNYDLILEGLLVSCRADFNYNLDQILDPKKPASGFNLLKLHGSINLYYCPECGQLYLLGPGKPLTPGGGEIRETCPKRYYLPCQNCLSHNKETGLKHFIIAPTLYKSYGLPALRLLWFRALNFLAAAREIVIIGYSLPEADILSYQLLDFSHRLSQADRRVYLVNGPRHVPRNFELIFGPQLINTGVYFEQWVYSQIL